jgi:hypothetical protein
VSKREEAISFYQRLLKSIFHHQLELMEVATAEKK